MHAKNNCGRHEQDQDHCSPNDILSAICLELEAVEKKYLTGGPNLKAEIMQKLREVNGLTSAYIIDIPNEKMKPNGRSAKKKLKIDTPEKSTMEEAIQTW
ncbi:hypothetical protein Syun_025731 [Stephania yunnanensis]|uniref:Uncharacterized protein n=1 Tax=Stephania yunnanensis TaxID=152371 RepID=A0AAP0HW15_9MAGN